jgi:hypothetical protein
MTDAELRRRRWEDLNKRRTIDEWEAWFEVHVNPFHEMKRLAGRPERRAWLRTAVDLLIVGWPVLLVGLVALMGWVALGVAIYRYWVSP